MRVIILGSAAGGGVPQWNCGCRNCTEARQDGRGRTQSSVAVSADGERWVLLNASPDLRTQLATHRSLWPPSGSRATPRSEEHTSELQSHVNLVCRLLLEKKKIESPV